MLAVDYGDDSLTQELDPNLDDDYIMLFQRRKAVQPRVYEQGKAKETKEDKRTSLGGEDVTNKLLRGFVREIVDPNQAVIESVTVPAPPPPPPPPQPPLTHSDLPFAEPPSPSPPQSQDPHALKNSHNILKSTLINNRKPIPSAEGSDVSEDSDWSDEEDVPESPIPCDRPVGTDAKNELHQVILKDNLEEFRMILHDLITNGFEMRKINFADNMEDKDNVCFANIFHFALKMNAIQISQYLVSTYAREMCLDALEFKDEMGRRKSVTCMHILAEENHLQLAEMMFAKLTENKNICFIKKTGYMRLSGRSYQEILCIHVACFYGHLDFVKFCLEHGMGPDDVDSNGETGLFWACKKDQIEVAQFLLNKKADVNLMSKNGTPTLYMAVRHNSIRCISLIMEYNPDVSAKRGVGFETPLILASVLGYEEIVQILVDSGTDVSESNSRGETSMHAAASEGWTNIMKILYNSPKGPTTINASSRTNQTPLHYAVAKGKVDAVQFLIQRGADSTLKDKHGNTVWHEAVASHKVDALKILLQISETSSWQSEVSALHLVAKTHDSMTEFEVIKSSGTDMNAKDSEGNTFLHIAAKHGNVSVVRDGLGIISANQKNSSGNTPLHEAAKSGYLEIVKLLLRSCQLDIRNNNSETALHCAVKSPHASAEVVNKIVMHMKNTNSLLVLNAPNESGNTALHLAAKYNQPEILMKLTDISPSILNGDGDNALHVATRAGNLEVLKEILKCFEYELQINQRTEDGETLLHLAAKCGHVLLIKPLIDFGIDLAVQDVSGNTFLHDLAEQAGADPDKKDLYNDVFDEVVKNCLKWWCKVRNVATVEDDCVQADRQRKNALWYLRSEILNNDGLTALQVAGKHGASSLVAKMIQIPSVFVQRSGKVIKYDVTNILPDTYVDNNKEKTGDQTDYTDVNLNSSSSVETEVLLNGKMRADESHHSAPDRTPVRASLLEVIVSKRPLNVADIMLDIEPLKQVADGYWMLYQFITSFLLVLHIAYMSVLSTLAIPEIRKTLMSNTSSNSFIIHGQSVADPNLMYWLFLLWPLGIVLQETYYIGNRIYRLANKLDVSEPAFDEIRSDPKQTITFSDGVVCLFLYYLPHVINLTFSTLVIIWFKLYITSNKYHGVLLAYIMLIGWLSTIAFTKTFRPMHGFTVMLRNIFIKDVLKFLFLYVFILLAFGFAFYCLALLSPEVYSEFNGVDEIFYQTIGMLLGAGDIMVEDIEGKYEASGYSPFHYKLIYLLYALVTVVILLNILIAMMNDSYGDIKSKEGVSFRVLSIQQAIHFEKVVPFLHSCFKHVRRRQQRCCKEGSRWYMEVEATYIPETKADEKYIILHTIINKLDKLNQQQVKIANTLSNFEYRIRELESKNKPATVRHADYQTQTA